MVPMHADELGRLLAFTDNNGTLTDEYAYQPYGRLIGHSGTTTTPFTWLGAYGVWDAGHGLYLTRYRAYDANLMRFAQVDPASLAGGFNLYAIANGSPLAFIDPLGLLTVGIGMSGSYNRWGAGGTAGFTVQFSYSQENGFNAGFFGFSGGGAVVGPAGASVTFDFTGSGLKDVSELKGTATELGIAGGVAGVIGGVAVAGPDVNRSGPQNLNTVSFGIGTPGGAGHLYTVNTRGITAQDFAQPTVGRSSVVSPYAGPQFAPSGLLQASVGSTTTQPNK